MAAMSAKTDRLRHQKVGRRPYIYFFVLEVNQHVYVIQNIIFSMQNRMDKTDHTYSDLLFIILIYIYYKTMLYSEKFLKYIKLGKDNCRAIWQ